MGTSVRDFPLSDLSKDTGLERSSPSSKRRADWPRACLSSELSEMATTRRQDLGLKQAQSLRAFADLLKDLTSVPSTHIRRGHLHLCTHTVKQQTRTHN